MEAFSAQPNAINFELCIADAADADTRILVCTQAIDAGQSKDRALAELHLNRGNGWYLKGEFDRALNDYETAIELDPASSRAYTGRGNIWRARKEPDRALAEYARAIQLDPANVRAYYNRALAWNDKGDGRKAAADYDQAIRLDPKNASMYQARGWVWFGLQDYQRAISDFSVAIALEPQNANYFQARGWTWFVLRDVAHALADLTEAVRLDPKFAHAYFQRANVLSFTAQIDGAISDFGEAIRLAPSASIYYYHRGLEFRRRGDYGGAISDFDSAIRIDAQGTRQNKSYVSCCFGRANLLFVVRGEARQAKGEIDLAIADFDEASRLDPKDASVLVNRGNAWHAKGEYDRAIADYGAAIGLATADPILYFNRANSLAAKGDLERAVADYDQALKLNPDYAAAYKRRGDLWYGLGRFDRAIADYDEALGRGGQNADAFISRGNARHMQGSYDLAIDDYDQALRLQPNNAIIYSNRAGSWIAKDDPDRAISDYDRAITLDPNFTAAYSGRGNAYLKKGDREHASQDFNTAMVLQPKYENGVVAHENASRGLLALKTQTALEQSTAEPTRAIPLNSATMSDPSPNGRAPIPIIPWLPVQNARFESGWAQSGSVAVLTYNGSVLFWNVTELTPLGTLPFKVHYATPVNGKPWVVTLRDVEGEQYNHRIDVFDYERLQVIDSFSDYELRHDIELGSVFPTYLAADASGDRIFAETNGDRIGIIDRRERRYRTLWASGEGKERIAYHKSLLSPDGNSYVAFMEREDGVGVFRIWNLKDEKSADLAFECAPDAKCEAVKPWFSADGKRIYSQILFRQSYNPIQADVIAIDISQHRVLWRHVLQPRSSQRDQRLEPHNPFSLSDGHTEIVIAPGSTGTRIFDGVTGRDVQVDLSPEITRELAKFEGTGRAGLIGYTTVTAREDDKPRIAVIDVHDGYINARIRELAGVHAEIKKLWRVGDGSKVAVLTKHAVLEMDPETAHFRKRRDLPEDFRVGRFVTIEAGQKFLNTRCEGKTITVSEYATWAEKQFWESSFDGPDDSCDVKAIIDVPELARLHIFIYKNDDQASTTVVTLDEHNGAILDSRTFDPKEFKTWASPVRVAKRREILGVNNSLLYVLDDSTLALKAVGRISGMQHGFDLLANEAGTRALIDSRFVDLQQRRAIDDVAVADISLAVASGENRVITGSRTGIITELDVANGVVIRTFDGPAQGIVGLARSSQKLVAGAADGTIHLYDFATGRRLAIVYLDEDIERAVVATPEGFVAAPESLIDAIKWRVADQLLDARTAIARDFQRPDLVLSKLAGDPEGHVRDAFAALLPLLTQASVKVPSIRIVTPIDGITTADASIRVTAEVKDMGGGIGRVAWNLNGMSGAFDARLSRGFTAVDPDIIERTLPLKPGLNTIEVSATDREQRAFSVPARINVISSVPEIPRPDGRPVLHILRIAVGNYADSRLARPGIAEATAETARRLARGNSRLFAETREYVLADAAVTDATLARWLALASAQMSARDVTIILIAGRGAVREDEQILLLHGASLDRDNAWQEAVPMSRLQELFAGLPARKLFILSDLVEPPASMTAQLASRRASDLFVLDRLIHASGHSWVGSLSRSPTATGSPEGLMSLIPGALEQADSDGNGTVSILELAAQIERLGAANSHDGGPMVIVRKKIVGSDFPVAVVADKASGQPDQIALEPTHALIEPTCVRPTQLERETCPERLAIGVLVRVLEITNGDALIARNGRRIGYVKTSAVVPIQ